MNTALWIALRSGRRSKKVAPFEMTNKDAFEIFVLMAAVVVLCIVVCCMVSI